MIFRSQIRSQIQSQHRSQNHKLGYETKMTENLEQIKTKLRGADLQSSIELLQSADLIVGNNDLDLMLSLALRLFVLGEDEQAHGYLQKAEEKSPNDCRMLKLKLFFLASVEEPGSLQLSEDLLKVLPTDDWVLWMQSKIRCNDLTSITMPALDSSWERLIFAK